MTYPPFNPDYMFPPEYYGWAAPTRQDAFSNAQAGPVRPPQWSLPPGHPMVYPPLHSKLKKLPHAHPRSASPSSGPSSSTSSRDHSPFFHSPMIPITAASYTPLTTPEDLGQSSCWAQPRGMMPSMYPPPYVVPTMAPQYTGAPEGNNAQHLPSTVSPPCFPPNLTLDIANLPAVEPECSSTTSSEGGSYPSTLEEMIRSMGEGHNTGAGLPSSFDFTFTVDPPMVSQPYNDTGILLQGQEDLLQCNNQSLTPYTGLNDATVLAAPAPERAGQIRDGEFSSLLASFLESGPQQIQPVDGNPYHYSQPTEEATLPTFDPQDAASSYPAQANVAQEQHPENNDYCYVPGAREVIALLRPHLQPGEEFRPFETPDSVHAAGSPASFPIAGPSCVSAPELAPGTLQPGPSAVSTSPQVLDYPQHADHYAMHAAGPSTAQPSRVRRRKRSRNAIDEGKNQEGHEQPRRKKRKSPTKDILVMYPSIVRPYFEGEPPQEWEILLTGSN
ncbi:hypothetical protein HYDPIDRAFT_24013 [Hydnomerulius pinastri MD-312]|nr:hypothetical protein HYDPIDRAFT_24013 [Hydnomerulius pinastri MD-312]